METGCFFSVSGYEPRPWVAEVADEVGVRLNVYNIPQKFTASLKLDPERTEKEKDLFFVLQATSNGVEVDPMDTRKLRPFRAGLACQLENLV